MPMTSEALKLPNSAPSWPCDVLEPSIAVICHSFWTATEILSSSKRREPIYIMMPRSLLLALALSTATSFQPTSSRAVTRTAPLQAGFATTTRKKKVKKGSKSKDAAGLTTDKGWTPLTELTERVELGAAKAVGRSA